MAQGPSLPALAWRNLWRNRRRTLITLVGIAFGMFLSVLFTGLGDASYSDMINYGAKMGGGHVAVQHEDYLDSPSLKKTVTGAHDIAESAREREGVTLVVERVSGASMMSTASNSVGAFFMAIDPEAETETSLMFAKLIVEGEMFAPDDDKGVIIGATMAETLDVKLGKKIVLTLTDKSGEIVTALVRVRGIVKTGADTVDGGLCLLPIDPVRKLLGYAPDEATAIAIFVDDHRRSDTLAAELTPSIPSPSRVLTWAEHQPDLAGMIDMKQSSTWVMEMIIMALLAAGIFNTLFVSVMERLREFGILSALGFTHRQLFSLVMWESLWLALVGLVGAGLMTLGPYYDLHTQGLDYSKMLQGGTEVAGVALLEPILYVSITGQHLFQLCLLVVFATLAAGLYPAWRAGRVPPADAIRLS
jgi:ABC-type lipoprotein release transport system permease subunit